MRANEVLRKALAILIAACLTGIAATAVAQVDKKIDCDKTPNDPSCQVKR